MPSFDTVLEADFVEVKNAVDNSAKEIGTRFDFKGSSAGLELKDKEITLFGDADFQLQQVEDIQIHMESGGNLPKFFPLFTVFLFCHINAVTAF